MPFHHQCQYCLKFFTSPRSIMRFCSQRCHYDMRIWEIWNLPQRLWSNIEQCIHAPICLYCCWPWKKACAPNGYGSLVFNRERTGTHVLAYMLWNQRSPQGMFVCHHCDNPPCCNPLHLFLGTHRTNTDDAIDKKRHAYGERHGMAKLKDSDIFQIRKMLTEGLSQSIIAKYFGVTQGTIWTIKDWLHWKYS